ncbi:MAG TPA: hypothetical protein VK463_15630 [Desulfomonilaceae bacterium]|nr:hypothetical protein [Desulfomonilaceae bacterium]
MSKIIAVLTLALLFAGATCFGQSETSNKKLIQVKPEYSESAPVPQPEPQIDPYAPVPPRPRDQLYVFWILGRLISYPIDKVEAYITTLRSEKKRDGAPVPASGGPDSNPFGSVNWREIPPAPPVANTQAGR